MTSTNVMPLITHNGLRGTAELREAGRYFVRLENGAEFEVDADLLTERDDHSLYLPPVNDDLPPRRQKAAEAAETAKRTAIPLAAERIRVERRQVETGTVIIGKVVHEREETIDEPTTEERVAVERIPIDKFVETAPPIREEGDTIVIPLVEEVLVVEKRLRLREEVRIARRREETRRPERVTLRSEDVEIERRGAESNAESPAE